MFALTHGHRRMLLGSVLTACLALWACKGETSTQDSGAAPAEPEASADAAGAEPSGATRPAEQQASGAEPASAALSPIEPAAPASPPGEAPTARAELPEPSFEGAVLARACTTAAEALGTRDLERILNAMRPGLATSPRLANADAKDLAKLLYSPAALAAKHWDGRLRAIRSQVAGRSNTYVWCWFAETADDDRAVVRLRLDEQNQWVLSQVERGAGWTEWSNESGDPVELPADVPAAPAPELMSLSALPDEADLLPRCREVVQQVRDGRPVEALVDQLSSAQLWNIIDNRGRADTSAHFDSLRSFLATQPEAPLSASRAGVEEDLDHVGFCELGPMDDEVVTLRMVGEGGRWVLGSIKKMAPAELAAFGAAGTPTALVDVPLLVEDLRAVTAALQEGGDCATLATRLSAPAARIGAMKHLSASRIARLEKGTWLFNDWVASSAQDLLKARSASTCSEDPQVLAQFETMFPRDPRWDTAPAPAAAELPQPASPDALAEPTSPEPTATMTVDEAHALCASWQESVTRYGDDCKALGKRLQRAFRGVPSAQALDAPELAEATAACRQADASMASCREEPAVREAMALLGR